MPGGVTQVKTNVNMCVRKVFEWTHISEVHDRRTAPFSEPVPIGRTLNSEFNLNLIFMHGMYYKDKQ